MKCNNKVLFFGRLNDIFSENLYKFLRKNFNNVKVFYSSNYNEKIPSRLLKWKGDYIFCFRSYLILSDKMIKKAKKAAINFHPGPPMYRGVGCLNYAIYNNEKNYGVTAHLIEKKIDNGKILMVKKFRIDQYNSLEKCLKKTHKVLYNTSKSIINLIKNGKFDIKKTSSKFKKYKWSNKIGNHKKLDNFYKINKNISKNNFERKIKSTYTKKFKPFLILHNKKFVLSDEK